jgi:flagellar hook-length control protein FliK
MIAPELDRLAEAQPLPTDAPAPGVEFERVAPQVLRRVEGLIRSGETTVQMHLHPESLGRIGLQLTSTADGVHVAMTADLPATGLLLQQHLNDLRHMLADSGLNVAALSVGVGQGQQGNGAFNWRQFPAAPPAPPTSEPEPAAEEPVWSVPGGSRVDYRI